jgi:hypothetical protein
MECKCGEQMSPVQIGAVVRIGDGVVRNGDAFRCGKCETITITGFGKPYHAAFEGPFLVDLTVIGPHER